VNLGFFSWFGYDLPFPGRLSLIAQAGFRDISVWLGSEEQLYSQGRSGEMRAIAAHEGLQIQCAHAACRDCNFLWEGTNENKRQLRNQIIHDLYLCKELHVPTMVMHACAGAAPPTPNQEGLDLIRDVAKHAEAANAVVAFENTRKPEVIDYVLSQVHSPYVGFCYDSCHDFLYSCKPGRLLQSWGHRLVYTHFNDTDGKLTRHWIPGKGIVDWQLIADVFPEQFAGNLSLEVEPLDPRVEPVEMFLRESLEAAQWLEASLRK